jgi:predicted Zn-dependent protease with MMP-like domain
MANEESIIEIIQKMVQEGESQEKIIQSLRDLGVNEEQAKRLLLIAQADTFTLLKKEINVLVKDSFENQKKEFEQLIHADVKKIEEQEKDQVKEIAKSQLKEVEEDLTHKTKAFEGRVNEAIGSSQKSVVMVKTALDSVQERLTQAELDVEQMKIHRFRKSSIIFSYAMLALGSVLLILSIYLIFSRWPLDSNQMLMVIVLMLASVTLMFASIIS